MSDFRIRPLHRQRNRRRKPVTVLGQSELAELLDIPECEVKTTLQQLGSGYHEDSSGKVWTTPRSIRRRND